MDLFELVEKYGTDKVIKDTFINDYKTKFNERD